MNLQQWNAEQARNRREAKRLEGATPEYHKALQARKDRALAKVSAGWQHQAMRYTTEGGFDHLIHTLNPVTFRRNK